MNQVHTNPYVAGTSCHWESAQGLLFSILSELSRAAYRAESPGGPRSKSAGAFAGREAAGPISGRAVTVGQTLNRFRALSIAVFTRSSRPLTRTAWSYQIPPHSRQEYQGLRRGVEAGAEKWGVRMSPWCSHNAGLPTESIRTNGQQGLTARARSADVRFGAVKSRIEGRMLLMIESVVNGRQIAEAIASAVVRPASVHRALAAGSKQR
jgi:hypothetical protein